MSKKNKNVIFVSHYTRNGVTYYAKDYGKKAFAIPADSLKKENNTSKKPASHAGFSILYII